jgi:hypothetical protein
MTDALSEALTRFGQLPMVTGIDIGLRLQDGSKKPLALRSHVERPSDALRLHRDAPVPRYIAGLPTQVAHYRYSTNLSQDAEGQCENHYQVHTHGLGQILFEYLGGQHPIVGQHHREAGNDGNQALIVSPYSKGGVRRMDQLLSQLESKIQAQPDTPATVLLYKHGQLSSACQMLDLVIKSRCQAQITGPLYVDGVGYYRLKGGTDQPLELGFKLLPS